MTLIKTADLIESVADALQFISYYHPMDYIRALGKAYEAEANPAALRETAARFAEAIRRGLWTPRSNRAAYLITELLPQAQKEIA